LTLFYSTAINSSFLCQLLFDSFLPLNAVSCCHCLIVKKLAQVRVTRLGEVSPTHWLIVYILRQLTENYRSIPNFRTTFFQGKFMKLCTNLAKNGLGYILSDFFNKLV
jgi:sulfur relay (sulfurtransferase) DsrC/TusE family protein